VTWGFPRIRTLLVFDEKLAAATAFPPDLHRSATGAASTIVQPAHVFDRFGPPPEGIGGGDNPDVGLQSCCGAGRPRCHGAAHDLCQPPDAHAQNTNAMRSLDRRSFLRLLGAAAPALMLPRGAQRVSRSAGPSAVGTPNVIILVLDALSATNMSVYGYPRPTTPGLEAFADRATVYHSHYSGGNFTIPGVATLLTGTYPWTNRAINHSGGVRGGLTSHNIFRAVGTDIHRLALPQSVWSNFTVSQFHEDIDELLPTSTFSELDFLVADMFPNDTNMAFRALDDFTFKIKKVPTSLVFGALQQGLDYRASARLSSDGYPRGLPHIVNYPIYFRLEKLFGGLASLLPNLPQPFFAYVHLFPPHAPYRPSRALDGKFIDGWRPLKKPVHRFASGASYPKLTSARRTYDEYIASIDQELELMLATLQASGVLDSSYLMITSDHGEMFERGEKAHNTALLYDPVVHVPLLVSTPGQDSRLDVRTPTNAVDILPTVAHVLGKPTPTWSEGSILPGLGGVADEERSTFSVEAKRNPAHSKLRKATVAMRRGSLKLIYYTGYESDDAFELYDLEADPEEMQDLYPAGPAVVGRLREELMEAMYSADALYTT